MDMGEHNISSYARVSTTDQSLQRQHKSNSQYAESKFDVEIGELTFYRDKSTGTNTERSGYKDMMSEAEDGDIDALIVKDFTRLARSLRDLERIVERLTDAGVEVHFIEEGQTFKPGNDDPMQTLLMQMLGAVAEFEAKITQQNVKEGIAAKMDNPDYYHGPAPLGFEKDNGELIENDDYDKICAVLDMVVKDEMSKRQAAKELDSSRPTIRRAIENRPDLYGL